MMGRYYHSFRENADLKLFVKLLLKERFGKLIVERENWLNHLENSQELQFIYSKAFSVSLPHIARTLYFRQRIESLIAIAEPEHLEMLQRSLEPKVVSSAEKELAKKIAGKDYVEGQSWELELANLERYYQRRRELLEGSITSSKVAELLGCQNRATVRDRRLANTLLGVKDGGVYKYPLWQFDPEGDDGVIDGLPQVLAALDVSDFTKLNWFNKSHLAFEGKTPIEILKQGRVEALVTEARAVGIGW